MPIYEYRCQTCGRVQEQFHRSLSNVTAPACAACPDDGDMTRVISRFATPKTEAQVLEQYGAPGPGAGPDAYRDPRQIGRWAEERFDQMGVEMPAEAKQMIDAARDGDLPAPVKDL